MSPAVSPGRHLIIDIRSTVDLTSVDTLRSCLESCALACGATILHTVMHHFGEGLGVTGVVVLAESHISIHTWPELNYAAVDIFMCGACDPHLAVPVLQERFQSDQITIRTLERRYS